VIFGTETEMLLLEQVQSNMLRLCLGVSRRANMSAVRLMAGEISIIDTMTGARVRNKARLDLMDPDRRITRSIRCFDSTGYTYSRYISDTRELQGYYRHCTSVSEGLRIESSSLIAFSRNVKSAVSVRAKEGDLRSLRGATLDYFTFIYDPTLYHPLYTACGYEFRSLNRWILGCPRIGCSSYTNQFGFSCSLCGVT
jgi:hypothetical protein